jgi:hypothetical protein
VTDAEIAGQLDWLRTWGRCAKLGIPLEPPKLPRSRKLRSAVELEAGVDPRVRVALDAILEAEHSKPMIIHRHLSARDVYVY